MSSSAIAASFSAVTRATFSSVGSSADFPSGRKNRLVYLSSDSRLSTEFAKNDSVGAPSPSGENATTLAFSLAFIAAMYAADSSPCQRSPHSRQSDSTSSFGSHES